MLYTGKGSIQKTLTWMIVSIVSVVVFLGYAVFVSFYFNAQKKESIVHAQTIAHVISQDLAKLVLLNSVSVASDITTKLDGFSHMDSLVLYKKDGTPVYQYSQDHKNFHVDPLPKKREPKTDMHQIKLYVEAYYQGIHLGYVQIKLKIKTFWEIAEENMGWFVLMYLFLILLSYILAIYYARKFTKPIRKLANFLQDVKLTGSLKKRMQYTEENEFGILYRKINLMLDQIEHATREQRIAAVAFETLSGMVITDEKKKVLQINRAYTQISGYKLEDVQGKIPPVLQHRIEDEALYREIEEVLKEKHFWSGEIRNYRKNGEIFSEYLTIQEVCNEEGMVTHYVFSFTDITQQKEAEEQVAFLMQYDPLTGLANKELLVETLCEKMKRSEEEISKHFILALDIKDFKLINDAYGYEVGDILLKEVSKRLIHEFADADMIAKIGVDEFILSYRNLDEKTFEAGYFAKMTAEYMLSVMDRPFNIRGEEISITVQIGIDLYDDTMRSVDEILKHSNIALQLSKQKDEKIAFFDKAIEDQARYQIDTYTQLQKALENQEFELYYQPQYDHHEHVIGAEALLRWKHPVHGVLTPYTFIPIAEKTGLIVAIGEWVLESACKQLAQWQNDLNTEHLMLAVNISVKQFKQAQFTDQVIRLIQKYRILPKRLKLELVESLLIEDIHSAIEKMHTLKAHGIEISMDDFGTGYSSLEYLKELPLDQIKIDRSFIMNMRRNEKDLALVKTMLSLGSAFGYDVVAEGVEEREDFILLKEKGCRYFQGFYFSQAVDIETFRQIIKLKFSQSH